MTRKDQKQFVENLCNSIKHEIQSKIDSEIIPENWDGVELRQLINEKTSRETYLDRNKRDKRYKEYTNTVLINNI